MYLPGGTVPPGYGAVCTPPDVVIEIVSPTARDARRDRVEKVTDYAAFGVRYYWLVDPALRTLEIYELGADGRYVRALGASEGRGETIPGCAGLTLDLDALWAEIDRLGPPAAPDDETTR
jgi:Uma2 family endonuclease